MSLSEPQTLPHSLAAPGLARRHLTSTAGACPAELVDVALVLTSELVTNAVLHGLGPVQLLVIVREDRLRIEVGDGRPGPLPRDPDRPAGTATSGRGLLIVDRCAERWGCHPRRGLPGKIVWFELRRSVSGPSDDASCH